MPFRETGRVKEREELIRLWTSGLYGKSELARHFGVSRPTIQLWIERHAANEPYSDRSRRPHRSPHQTADEIAQELVACRQKHPHWGPKKIGDVLRISQPDTQWPADSTIGEVLNRAGLVSRRKRGRRSLHVDRRTAVVTAETLPGQVMTADHKGHFLLGNSRYCFPLTIADPVSRFVYAIDALESTSGLLAKPVFERVFREHGLPEIILTDNGIPFALPQVQGRLSRFGVWCAKYAIDLRHTRPGRPGDNAIHERMHRTLKAETARPPKANFVDQQARFDTFRVEFNNERPHEGIGRRPPASVYRTSPRPFPIAVPEPEYPGHFEVRRVHVTGRINFRGSHVFISESLGRELVGLEETDDGVWSVHFFRKHIGRFDEQRRELE
jgi:transposase InsO family protein